MSEFRQLVPGVLVAGQIDGDDIARAAADGVGVVVVNRPDHEEPGQPTAEETGAAVRAAGMTFVFAPIRGLPDPQAVSAVAAALDSGKTVLLHCKSGMRSAAVWAMAVGSTGQMSRDDILTAARGAGYDLGGLPFQAPG